MRRGRVEEAAAVAEQVSRATMASYNEVWWHCGTNTGQCAKEAWAKVRQLTKARGKGRPQAPPGLTVRVFGIAATQQCPLTADTKRNTAGAGQADSSRPVVVVVVVD